MGIEREKIDFSDPENVRLLKSGKLGYYIRDYLEYVLTKALAEALAHPPLTPRDGESQHEEDHFVICP